ncbi:MAG TPA: CRTAC1 family protein [Chthonomonadaceae bacterium]|nr:CRTAC1 family protein [Chthonomonadaceae bacterium]
MIGTLPDLGKKCRKRDRVPYSRRGLVGLAAILLWGLVGCNPPVTTAPPSPNPTPASSALFEDVIPTSGIDFAIKQTESPLNIQQNVGHGVALIDFDGDGLLDIVFIAPDHVRLYKNLGHYKFQEVTANSGLRQAGFWQGVAVGDYDNDGRPDLYLCGYDCSALYHNEGGGKFREVTAEAGLQVVKEKGYGDWRTSAGFADLDGDGKLDLYVCRYAEFGPKYPQHCHDPSKPSEMACAPNSYKPIQGFLYRNMGGGRFQDVTRESGLATANGRGLGVAFADYNDDGRVDIAIANDEIAGDLFQNLGNFKFVNKGVESGTGVNQNGKPHGGMGIDWADYDGDGKLDLFVATFQYEVKTLYHNMGGGTFLECAEGKGITGSINRWVTFGAKFLDYDNDGWPDLIMTSGHVIDNTAELYPGTQYRQPVQVFHNNQGQFVETTQQLGPKAQRLMVGRGLAVGDLDNSGRLDVVVTDLDGPPMLLQNQVKNANHWLTLTLVGKTNARDGFGARVVVRFGTRQTRIDATNSGSFLAANDPRLHFGLGSAAQADSITVRWPNGKTDTYKNVPADAFYILTEGAKDLTKSTH